jgi:ATP-binding cassette, subfamily B, multidrug efflux pump
MPENKEKNNSLNSLKRLWPYLQHYRGRMIFGILCVLLSNGMAVVSPWVLKLAIDALNAGQKTSYAPYALAILGATLLQATFLFLMRKVMIGVSRDIEYDLRNDIYKHLQLLSSSYYGRMYTGDLMSRVNNDLSAVRMVLGPAIMYSVNTFFTLAFALTMMAIINPLLSLLSLLPLPIVSWMVMRYGRVIHNRFKEVQEQFSQISTTVQENLSGIKVIKAFGREQQEIENFRGENLKYMRLNRKLIKVWGILYPMVEMLAGIGILVVLWWGGRQVVSGILTLGEFVAFTTYLAMLIWPSIALGWVVNITQRGAASMTRLNEILDEKPQITDPLVPAVSLDYKIRGKIQFRNVSFSYSPSQPVLKNLNFTIEPGKTVSFVGATGGGKTSLLQLIPRMYEPVAGEILIDDIPIRDYPLSALRGEIGFVPQDAFLFSDTIQENIAFGMDKAEEHSVAHAAQMASFDKEILSFPLQYKTVIGERGITLSGGQKQRATIARALGIVPSILILDDSFSNVDTHTEEQILQALREFRKGRTCILVSHRISTVQDSDWIYVLEDGKILEQGDHQNLLRQKGIYYDLYQKQLIEEELKIKKVG